MAPGVRGRPIAPLVLSAQERAYLERQLIWLSAFETVVNVVFKFPPRACTTAIIATEMPAAMRPYSIAVAPD